MEASKTLHVATSRPVGKQCIEHAEAMLRNDLRGWSLVDKPEACDAFISVMYDGLVSESFIAARKCFNFHPGILPEYRGSGAFSWAIINGEKEAGITLHELDVNIDSGPVIAVGRFPIEPWDDAGSLFEKGMSQLLAMFRFWLPLLLNDDYSSTPQDEGKARTYYRRDLTKAMDLTRFVRAFSFAGKPPAWYNGRDGNKQEVQW